MFYRIFSFVVLTAAGRHIFFLGGFLQSGFQNDFHYPDGRGPSDEGAISSDESKLTLHTLSSTALTRLWAVSEP